MGSNNKRWDTQGPIDYNRFFEFVRENERMKELQQGEDAYFDKEELNFLIEETSDEDELESYDPSDFSQMTESGQDKNVRIKFIGAFVLNTEHIQSTGFRIYEVESKYIHEFIIDFDVKSEYPSSILVMNASNETMVGKVFITDPDDIKIPIYNEFHFVGKEESDNAKIEPGSWVMEQLSTGDVLNLGHVAFHLPNIETILNHIGNNLKEFEKNG